MRMVRSTTTSATRSRFTATRLRAIVVLAAASVVLTACDVPSVASRLDDAVAQSDTARARADRPDDARERPRTRRHRKRKHSHAPKPTPPADDGTDGRPDPDQQPTPPQPEPEPAEPAPEPDAPGTGAAHGVNVSASNTGHTGELERHPGGPISGDGVTLERKDFAKPVVVTGDNVTIRNSRFSLADHNVLQVGQGRNTVIERNTINGGNRSLDSNGILVQGANKVTIRGNDISQHANGIRLMGSATITENYIHDLIPGGGGPHRDNIEIYGGATNSSIARNRIVHEASETSPLNFASWGAPIDNIRVEDNFVDGGNCTITYDPYDHSYPTRVQFVGNVFGDNAWYDGCLFNFVGTSAFPAVAGTADTATHAANPRRYLWQDNAWGATGSASKDGTRIGVPTR